MAGFPLMWVRGRVCREATHHTRQRKVDRQVFREMSSELLGQVSAALQQLADGSNKYKATAPNRDRPYLAFVDELVEFRAAYAGQTAALVD